ncbi:Nicotinamide-nucleotide adenylyltransferase [Candidatus Anstonella stagnisolia]|nr:Nicotinamide-nucleotide adenylyltransferase [Candidatus Anstonella stagnisolia]
METSSAIFIGRFQPLHKGHLYALKYVAKRHAKFLIVIGSAQKKGKRNPFSVQTRKKMLNAVLRRNKLQAKIKILKDYSSNEKWVREFQKLAGNATCVYSNNSLVKKLCKKAGFSVVPIPFYKRYKYYATLIRERMHGKKSWKQLVPKEVLEIISS